MNTGDHSKTPHVTTIAGRVLQPEDGLLLGNGDLSVSVYQRQDEIVWRFGKGDVWDRRLDLSINPKPAHIEEIAHGIRDEGWTCGPYGGPVEAAHGTANPRRMRDICQGTPPSYSRRPFPCPKPVGELALHLPADLQGLDIRQQLSIEEAIIRITCLWASGEKMQIECFIPTTTNVLAVNWVLTGAALPLRFSLYRWADPTIREFGETFFAHYRHAAFLIPNDPGITPLAPPTVTHADGWTAIEQTFPPDGTFPDGFRYRLVPLAGDATVEPVDMGATREARLHITPPEAAEGRLMVAVVTGRDSLPHPLSFDSLAIVNRVSAQVFWSRSRIHLEDPLLENLWHETLHAKRCVYRSDTVPPGLFLPSTVNDYSHWHSDYHTNYNFQSPFLGDYPANHPELGDAYFRGVEYFLPVGRKIARDYYGCRGLFIQLSGFPLLVEDDPLGCAPMGRMAYMTGWATNPFWWRYLYTLDLQWLSETGYPVIRDTALFYTDFLKMGSDSLYHAFPSNQSEDGFTGRTKEFTDRPQIMRHARYSLRNAIAAAEALGKDPELQRQWTDILEHLAPEEGSWDQQRRVYPTPQAEHQPPEFIAFDGLPAPRQADPAAPSVFDAPGSELWEWYAGKFPYIWMQSLRTGTFCVERDLPAIRRLLQRWRHANGLIWAMAVSRYGHAGAWTETLGINGPLQELLLQSWDGVIRVFPAWPEELDASFENLRSEGAFLVTAARQNGTVTKLEITSESGAACVLHQPWPGRAVSIEEVKTGSACPVQAGPDGFLRFPTIPGRSYRLTVH